MIKNLKDRYFIAGIIQKHLERKNVLRHIWSMMTKINHRTKRNLIRNADDDWWFPAWFLRLSYLYWLSKSGLLVPLLDISKNFIIWNFNLYANIVKFGKFGKKENFALNQTNRK